MNQDAIKDHGGPAFPTPPDFFTDGSMRRPAGDGMPLRDYFAAKAMQGMLANPGNESSGSWQDADGQVMANHAYSYADFMMKARQV